ncbi:hypothetical protein JXB22_08125 [candidate division WOR-3 bacterium]|nr:hypothetical protein [candidate division WOR-3 bacterium]
MNISLTNSTINCFHLWHLLFHRCNHSTEGGNEINETNDINDLNIL